MRFARAAPFAGPSGILCKWPAVSSRQGRPRFKVETELVEFLLPVKERQGTFLADVLCSLVMILTGPWSDGEVLRDLRNFAQRELFSKSMAWGL